MAEVSIPLADLPPGRAIAIEAGGTRVVVCRSPAGVHAMPEFCPHQALSLEGGRVRGSSIICPHHGARFSLENGRSLSPITPTSLDLLPCRIVGDTVVVTCR
jgi:3-phenylpropionate/trans-cinnamate dioxygenase ferredoxin subunit